MKYKRLCFKNIFELAESYNSSLFFVTNYDDGILTAKIKRNGSITSNDYRASIGRVHSNKNRTYRFTKAIIEPENFNRFIFVGIPNEI